MAYIRADLVQETTSTSGAENIATSGATIGSRPFSSVCSVGDTFPYSLRSFDLQGNLTGDFEIGIGKYIAPNLIERTTVLVSTNSGKRVALSSPLAQIAIVLTAEDFSKLESSVDEIKTNGLTAESLKASLAGQITESELDSELNSRIDLIDIPGTGLLDRVVALQQTYGDTVSAAASATSAAQAVSDAIAARAAAELAAGNAQNAASASSNASLAAQSANQAAATSADAAATSASNASTYVTNAEAAASASDTSRLGAQAAQGSAQDAAAAAVTARDTATTEAGNAGDFAAAASTSANTASTKAGEASSSAASAATSASNAAGSANSASTSAQNAATSADTAGGAASAASGYASSASTSANSAGNSASAANTAKVAAESARDAAAGSASAASTSASTASTAASDAGTSASAASASASTASTKAGEALSYRDAAAQSATDAQGYATASAQNYSGVNARLDNAGGTGVSIEQAMTATASSISGLSGQYTVKVDVNGYVTGFGLASTAKDGTPTSEFAIYADSFRVVAPGGTPKVMFSVESVAGGSAITFAGSVSSSGYVYVTGGASYDGTSAGSTNAAIIAIPSDTSKTAVYGQTHSGFAVRGEAYDPTGQTTPTGYGGMFFSQGGTGCSVASAFAKGMEAHTQSGPCAIYASADAATEAVIQSVVNGTNGQDSIYAQANGGAGVYAVSYNGDAVVASGAGYAFYAQGGLIGPFTAAHDGLLSKSDTPAIGDIMVDTGIYMRKDVSNTLATMTLSSSPNQKAVIGVFAMRMQLDSNRPPTALDSLTADQITTLALTYDRLICNAVGEGQINVCGENGDISAGDYICASSTPGKGMRQADDLLHGYTVAKAREGATFASPGDVKMIACTYHCG